MSAPITIKTLHQATTQQVFDQVARHLLAQGAQSREVGSGCRYRGDGDLKCAAGCLIADDEYDAELEGNTWLPLANSGIVPQEHAFLIRDLQNIHDNHLVASWPALLEDIGSRFGLSTTVLKEFV